MQYKTKRKQYHLKRQKKATSMHWRWQRLRQNMLDKDFFLKKYMMCAQFMEKKKVKTTKKQNI